ncbi:MAG: ABC transporter substrate-binding protein [Oscillospiraceae bacterium]
MKKVISMIVAFCAVLAIIILCVELNRNPAPKPADADSENKTINIGVFEPLSGDREADGLQEALGITYANSVCPEVKIGENTYSIQLIKSDNKSDITLAPAAARNLLTHNISAVLGSSGSDLSAACADIFNEANTPFIGISGTSSVITESRKNCFHICSSDAFQGRVMANFAYSRGLSAAAVMTQVGEPYSIALGKYFSEEFVRLGGKVSEFSFNSAQKNFRDVSAKIKNAKVDLVFMPSSAETGGVFIKQARNNGLTCPIMGGSTWDCGALITASDRHGREVFFPSEFDENDKSNVLGAEFAINFRSWLKDDDDRIKVNGDDDYISPVSALGYDAYMLTVEAIKKAASTDPAKISEALQTLSYEGTAGKISFDKAGTPGKTSAYIKTIDPKTQKFTVLQTSSVSAEKK